MGIFVSSSGLDWAIKNLERLGVNDLLPRSHFIPSIKADWSSLKKRLEITDLESHRPAVPRIVMAPKSSTAFRVSHDIDIIDHLLLSALIFDIGEKIESHRDPLANKRIFSNRYHPSEGNLFLEKTYDLFRNRNLELAYMKEHKYVLSLDLNDFFNQISTHRVENALEEVQIDRKVAKCIEEHLLHLNLRSSRGIPIGQQFSDLLAEASLLMIDQWLIGSKINFTRYVDDFRVFVRSYKDALIFLHNFTELLNRETLKFTLNDQKTRIYKRATFLKLESVDPVNREESERFKRYQAKVAEALEWIQETWEEESYARPPEDENELDESIKKEKDDEAFREALGALFDEALFSDPPDYTMIRHLLTKCTLRRRNVLIGRVVSHLERLAPVFSYAMRYLRAVSEWFQDTHRAQLLEYTQSGNRSEFVYTREWLAWLFLENSGVLPDNKCVEVLTLWSKSDGCLHLLFIAALINGSPEPIRDRKQKWQTLGFRERRWFVLASKNLPPSERSAFLKTVALSGDPIEASIAKDIA